MVSDSYWQKNEGRRMANQGVQSGHGSTFWISVLTEGKRDDSSAFILLPILFFSQDLQDVEVLG